MIERSVYFINFFKIIHVILFFKRNPGGIVVDLKKGEPDQVAFFYYNSYIVKILCMFRKIFHKLGSFIHG